MASPTSQFVELWRRLSVSQRVVIGVAALATLALIAGIVFYGSQPDYAVLFSDLKSTDAQVIVEKLKAAKVPYQISNNGTTISVPSDQVSELRLEMAAPGTLSGGHVGFDIFDKTNFGATDFTQQVNYQRALEGELARTLEGMREVQTARVHITRSRESVFTDKAEPAKASVMLVLRGRELSPERTEAIVSLVSSAVEGLGPENVSVMDNEGRLLTDERGKKGIKGAGAIDSFMEARRKFETESVEQIVSLLEPIAGAGRVRANVTADIDFSQVEQMEETFDPKSAVARTQQTSQEFRNPPGGAGGVAGTRANDPTAPQTTQTTSNQSGNGRTTSSATFEISKVTKHTIGNGGKVERLSVSVLIDENDATAGLNSADGLKKMQDLVSAAVGINPTRGDQINVQLIPFQNPTIETQPQSWLERYRDLVKVVVKYGVLALVALLLMIFVIRPARRALRAAAEPSDQLLLASASEDALSLPSGQFDMEAISEPLTVAEMEASTQARTVAEMEGGVSRSRGGEEGDDMGDEFEGLEVPKPKKTLSHIRRNQIIKYSKDEPEKVAMAVRNWLQASKK